MEREDNNNTKDTSREIRPRAGGRSLSRRDDTVFRDVFNRFFDDDSMLEPFGTWRIPRLLSRIDQRWFPRVDVSETDTEVKVVADVPGINPDDIDIEVKGNRMIISGTAERETETDKSIKPYRYERSYGEFSREFMLPAEVDEDQVKAAYKDGVLTVTLPKVEQEKKNRIKIEKQN